MVWIHKNNNEFEVKYYNKYFRQKLNKPFVISTNSEINYGTLIAMPKNWKTYH